MSETVRTLTELRHTPASPSLLRRKVAQPLAQAQASTTGDDKVLARAAGGVGAAAVLQLAGCAAERATTTIR